MSPQNIYALKVGKDWRKPVHHSLKDGEGRFGWSYIKTGDLRELKNRIQQDGKENLSDDEVDCYQEFLLELTAGDWVVYINVPEYGQCTVAEVAGEYYWNWEDEDFNHRFPVDPESIRTFNRNDKAVHPALSTRLKLQGRWWRIYTRDEFGRLLKRIEAGELGERATKDHRLSLLGDEMRPLLAKMTEKIHHTHPNYKLEELIAEVLRGIPVVQEVKAQGGAGDHGADLIATIEEPHPITGHIRQTVFLIQVKSFKDKHSDRKAVEDIKRAFEKYPSADEGVIVSTAAEPDEGLEDAVASLERESGKAVHLLIGEDVAAFVLRHGWELLG